MPRLPDAPEGIRLVSNEDMARIEEDQRIPTIERCLTCSGKGSFLWWGEGREEVVEWECNCRAQWRLHMAFLAANIGITYQRLEWLDYQGERQAVAQVYDYLAQWEWNERNGVGLVLYGNIGSGKTLLATLTLKTLLAKGLDCYHTTFANLITTFTAGWNSADKRDWFHRRIKNASVLVIDDIGRETKTSINLPESIFDDVLRHRLASARPTVVTTNCTLDQLHTGYGGNVMSLLTERSSSFEFKGADFRLDGGANQRLKKEQALGIIRPVTVG